MKTNFHNPPAFNLSKVFNLIQYYIYIFLYIFQIEKRISNPTRRELGELCSALILFHVHQKVRLSLSLYIFVMNL